MSLSDDLDGVECVERGIAAVVELEHWDVDTPEIAAVAAHTGVARLQYLLLKC